MNPKRFFTGLGITVLVQLIINLGLLQIIPGLKQHATFLFVCIIVMMTFCLALYGAARVMAQSKVARLYIQLIMIAVFLKMFLCLALVVIYKNVFLPADHTFVWSFLFIYITSAIFEVMFMDKVGRQKNTTHS